MRFRQKPWDLAVRSGEVSKICETLSKTRVGRPVYGIIQM